MGSPTRSRFVCGASRGTLKITKDDAVTTRFRRWRERAYGELPTSLFAAVET